MAHRELRRVGARPEIFWDFDLLFSLDHLVHEWQTCNEADHGDEPWGTGMGGDKGIDAAVAVDPRGIVEVAARRILMALAKAHQRLMCPRIIVVDRDLDDPGRELAVARLGGGFKSLQLRQHVVGANHIRVEADLKRGVGRTDLCDAADLAFPDRIGHRQRFEEGIKRHLLVDLDKDVLVASKGIPRLHRSPSLRAVAALPAAGSGAAASQSSSQHVCTAPARTSSLSTRARCRARVVGRPSTWRCLKAAPRRSIASVLSPAATISLPRRLS